MRFLLLNVCLLFSLSINAQDWKKLEELSGKQKQYAEHNAICLLDSIGVQVNESGSGSFIIRKVIKIQKPEGALNYRIVKYDYDPLTAFAEFKTFTIYKADGSTRSVPVTSVKDYAAPARAIYWGARQIMIEPGRLDAGDIIDYTIEKKGFTYALLADNGPEDERFIPPMRGHYYDIVPFWVDEPTVKKVYRVSLPEEKELQYEFYQGECGISVRPEGKNKSYTFTKTNIMPFKREPNMQDLFDVAPKLFMSSTPNWKEKSLWFYKVNEDYGSFEATPEAQKKVDELIKGCKTEMDKISVLTHWVADNMRYSGISMGKGEGYTLHNTEMNFTDRCGVCKDKAALLISMLRMAGMEAYPAMTMAGSRVETIPADHFNHSVAIVKLSDGTYMPLDPTWVPFIRELWSSAEQQQHYLPGVPEGSDICLTPVSAPENHYLRMKSTSTLNADGQLNGELIVTAEGQTDGRIRGIFTRGFQSEWETLLERELMNISPNAQLVNVDYGKDPKNYTKAPIKITFKYIIPDYAITGSDNVLLFKPVTMSNIYGSIRSYMYINTDMETRNYGFKDACSHLVELDETILLPKGYKLVQEEYNENYNSQAADFSGTLKQENNRIIMKHQLALKKRVYEVDDWQGFRTAVNMHKAFGKDYLTVKK